MTVLNQSNYSHEKFWEDINGSFQKIKKLIKSLMLFNMVGNVASIFSQVYTTKVTLTYSFFPDLLHTVQFTFLSFL